MKSGFQHFTLNPGMMTVYWLDVLSTSYTTTSRNMYWPKFSPSPFYLHTYHGEDRNSSRSMYSLTKGHGNRPSSFSQDYYFPGETGGVPCFQYPSEQAHRFYGNPYFPNNRSHRFRNCNCLDCLLDWGEENVL